MTHQSIFYVVAVVLMLSACYKDETSVNETFVPDPPQVEVETQLTGFAYRADGSTIGGVTVSSMGKLITSDANGYFDLGKIRTSQDEAYLKVSKQGYFPTIMSFSALAGETHSLNPTLFNIDYGKGLDPSEDQEFDVQGHGRVYIPANSVFSPLTSDPHSDIYIVGTKKLTPEEQNLFFEAGWPRTQNIHVNKQIIEPEETFIYSLTTIEGTPLSCKNADIFVSSEKTVGDELQLFIQQENGSFTRVDSFTTHSDGYTLHNVSPGMIVLGKVRNAIVISGTIMTNEGLPLSHATITDVSSTRKWMTSSNGQFRNWLPETSDRLQMTNSCQSVIHDFDISGQSDNLQLTAALDLSEYRYYSARVSSCNGTSLTSGYVISGQNRFPVSAEGHLRMFQSGCETNETEASIFAHNEGEPLKSFSLPDYGFQENDDLQICESDPNTEAFIVIGQNSYHYKQCEAIVQVEGSQITRFEFAVAGLAFDEVHRFVLETDGGSRYWKTPSIFTADGYKALSIRQLPVIQTFELSGHTMMSVSFQDVLFEDRTGQRIKGELNYLFTR